MEIITQAIPTKSMTVKYIRDELERLDKSQEKESKINLSLDLTKPEYITAKKTEQGFDLNYIRNNACLGGLTVLSADLETYITALLDMVIHNDEKVKFEQKCYELYQLEWMMSHGYSLNDLYKAMLKYEKDMFDPEDFTVDGDGNMDFNESDLERAAEQARDIFLYQEGFDGSQIFARKEEFLDAEYQDAAYMKWLFETQVNGDADKLKALYTKYTGKKLSCVADLEVQTDAGVLRAYKTTDSEHPGICIMLQPKGHDVEIDVTMAEADDKDINIVNWGDATTEDSTHRETLLWNDIEATLRPRVLSKEELKPIIFDEWKKFTFYDGEHISADEIDNVPQDLLDEIAFRCDSLETDDITQNIRACLEYAKEHGTRALIKEMDDCNIWNYIG